MIRYFLSICLAILLLPAVFAAEAPAPYDLHVELSFAQASGDEGMREELELQLLSELRRSRCFRSVPSGGAEETETGAAGRQELRLIVAVSELFEETTYDTSIAERADPLATEQLELLHTSRVYAVLDVALVHPANGTSLRTKRLRSDGSHRPLILGEDARHTALSEATIEAAKEVRRFACKGGPKRLSKEIAAASRP